MRLRVFFQPAVRVGSVFTLSLVDVGIVSVGVVSAMLCVLMLVWVAVSSGIDVTSILIEAVGVAGVSMTFTNCERQSAALLLAPFIQSNLLL